MPGHQVVEDWMGEPVTTLADLFPSPCRAVLVGINPSPVSVSAGHYWQGKNGQQKLLPRLREAKLLAPGHCGAEDDSATERGVGFTDIVKRPTGSSKEVQSREYEYGRPLLRAKLESLGGPLVIFAYGEVAKRYFDVGGAIGTSFISRRIGPSAVFVMPGPYEATDRVAAAIAELAWWVRERVGSS